MPGGLRRLRPGILCSIASSVRGRSDALKAQREGESSRGVVDVEIFGPPGIRDYVRQSLSLTLSHIASGDFNISIRELTSYPHSSPGLTKSPGDLEIAPDSNGTFDLISTGNFEVKAAPLRHTVPCFGYAIKEKSKRGAMRVSKLVEAGIGAGPIRAKLKAATKPFTLPDGRVVRYLARVSEPSHHSCRLTQKSLSRKTFEGGQ